MSDDLDRMRDKHREWIDAHRDNGGGGEPLDMRVVTLAAAERIDPAARGAGHPGDPDES